MTVRRIKEDELDKLLQLYKYLHIEDDDLEPAVSKKVWKEILNNEHFNYFVIEQDDKIVCSCNITIIPNLTRGGRSIGLIENVVTHSDYRHRSLGKMIIKSAIDYAKIMNCYKVMLLSSSKRKDAHQFYESLGFSSSDKIGFSLKIY